MIEITKEELVGIEGGSETGDAILGGIVKAIAYTYCAAKQKVKEIKAAIDIMQIDPESLEATA